MSGGRYWFPRRPARSGWGWGLPVVWQGWAALLVFVGVFVAGEILLVRHGPLVLSSWGLFMGGALVGVLAWKGESLELRDDGPPGIGTGGTSGTGGSGGSSG